MNGWIVIDKPIGISSAGVVGKVKWLLQLKKLKKKIGHAGTLDPLATGVLPLAVGEATKVVQFLTDADKVYEFEVTWGQERDTDDAEGDVMQISDIKCQISDIEKVMESFKGEIEQMPPQYSALKVDGKRAYDIARSGEVADIKSRKVTIYDMQLRPPLTPPQEGGVGGGLSEVHSSRFTVHCSKGTYIRSIARDMGRKLGCYGFVSELRRVGHGCFDINNAISLEKLEELCQKGDEQQAILPVDDVLDDILELKLTDEEAQQIRNGIVLNKDMPDCGLVKIYHENTLLAIAEIYDGKLKTRRVFNL